ncbi:hypothetical protein OPIT5_18620 [Opitutaceae bacterium TAV5]|nr:hypothetical protein OPIT5_18620 [Opitutaceae bacterium TAV5]
MLSCSAGSLLPVTGNPLCPDSLSMEPAIPATVSKTNS